MSTKDLWSGLNEPARARLEMRNYRRRPLIERLRSSGAEAGELAGGPTADLADGWIPGVEIFKRVVWHQRHRGWFAEVARRDDPSSTLARIGMWPQQWSTATMFAGTAKGFHIHPPHIPDGQAPEAWLRRLFIDEPRSYGLRLYDREQWDAMFFVRGICEMFLIDERAGMPQRKMRFLIDGDDRPGPNNVGVVIPPGVAHAVRSAGSDDVLMVYGTSTQFVPENEGRLFSDVEEAPVPPPWAKYFEA
jgi:dTDP-4-dehydrorhamnose 3,5-epimerase-like enzyme